MQLISTLLNGLVAWFAQAVPAAFDTLDAATADDQRRSVHDVTIEQLGIAHWSCHTHF
ncbi:hypothetical protein [uncultured Bosea sp.]|uniref:hypothetical protein n=1 Tax=uncultured Bosea sp. TaxID=211457 RepID=UPI0025CE15BE|nr:hypothetical protein [uncultured Bosea sp.]